MTQKFVGVLFAKGTFHSIVHARSKRHFAGAWMTADEAAIARDRALIHFDAPERRLQLPERSRSLGPASPDELCRLARLKEQQLHGPSPYLGVTRADDHWRIIVAEFSVRGYESAQEAALARDRLALYVFGAEAVLNFPELMPQPASALELRREKRQRSGGAVGVCPGSKGNFRAYVVTAGKHSGAGHWPTIEEAVLARDRLLLHLGRPCYQLAMPERSSALGPASSAELQRLGRARMKEVAGASSCYRGVMRDGAGRWTIFVRRKGRIQCLHGYSDEEEAAVARDRLALYVYGRDALLNFPDRKLLAASVLTLRRELGALREEREEKSSRYRGVLLDPKGFDRPWDALVGTGGRQFRLGSWHTSEQAAIAHDRAVLYYGLARVWLNFPERASELVAADAETLRRESRLHTRRGRRMEQET